MAYSRTPLLAAAAMALVAAAALVPTSAAKKFTVGDDAGWNIGVDYKAWARGKEFKVGDILVFRPNNTRQDVVSVNKASFDNCVTPANATVWSSAGKPCKLVLPQPGTYYFICDAEGACESGMKLAVNVH